MVSPLDLTPDHAFTPRDAGSGRLADIPILRPCGIGSRGVVVITRVSQKPLGVFTDHAEEVADALTALLASARPSALRTAPDPALPADPMT